MMVFKRLIFQGLQDNLESSTERRILSMEDSMYYTASLFHFSASFIFKLFLNLLFTLSLHFSTFACSLNLFYCPLSILIFLTFLYGNESQVVNSELQF